MAWADVRAKIEWFSDGSTSPASTWGSAGRTSLTQLSSGDRLLIEKALKEVYEGSPRAAAIIDGWIVSNTIKLGGLPLGEIGAAVRTGLEANRFAGFDITGISNFHYFDNNGQLVAEKLGITVIHELIHMMTGADDLVLPSDEISLNTATYDHDGPTLREQNLISIELEWNDNIQVGYSQTPIDLTLSGNQFEQFKQLKVGYAYTQN